jgi:hypothetical protein
MNVSKLLRNKIERAEDKIMDMTLMYESLKRKVVDVKRTNGELLGIAVQVIQVYEFLLEIGDDVQFDRAIVTSALKDSGHFVKNAISAEDKARNASYRANFCLRKARAKHMTSRTGEVRLIVELSSTEKKIIRLSDSCKVFASTVHIHESTVSSSKTGIEATKQAMEALLGSLQARMTAILSQRTLQEETNRGNSLCSSISPDIRLEEHLQPVVSSTSCTNHTIQLCEVEQTLPVRKRACENKTDGNCKRVRKV